MFAVGFQSAVHAMLTGNGMLAQLNLKPDSPDGAILIASLSHDPDGMFSSGSRDPGARFRPLEVPQLRSPPGAKWDRGGGSSGGGDHMDIHIQLTTPLSCADIRKWYAPQLAAA